MSFGVYNLFTLYATDWELGEEVDCNVQYTFTIHVWYSTLSKQIQCTVLSLSLKWSEPTLECCD